MYIMGIYRNLWKENILLNKMGFDHPKYAARVLMFTQRSDFPPKVPPPHSSLLSPVEIWAADIKASLKITENSQVVKK